MNDRSQSGTERSGIATNESHGTLGSNGDLVTFPGKNEILLSANGIRKGYKIGRKEVEVLRGVHLLVERGEFLALRGASGAGKSTLLHLLGGLDTPNSGEIWFRDRNLASLSARELARFRNEKVGLVFQSYHTLPELTALENVCLPARIARMNCSQAEDLARDLLERVGLKDRMDHKPVELSGGEQQRVAVARGLINSPELILADEPTGNLDSRTGQEIIELLCSLRVERNATLIVATHDSTIAARAPRIIELVDGRLGDS
ncbi:MAG: ABC transporter ATP-binding protein [Verrucomicrobia bacterium]|nr:ABC transporter ATP-binding protein [Verrucomicrobiota bacterium]